MIGRATYDEEPVTIVDIYNGQALITPGQAALLTWVDIRDLTNIIMIGVDNG